MQTQSNEISITNNRNKTLLELIRQGLEFCNNKNTNKMLGNRLDYLGLSDISRYYECPRAALANKLFPAPTNLKQLLTLQRGHWFEQGLGDLFTNLELNYLHQLEITYSDKQLPIRAHLDFTLVWEKPYPAVRIIEVKSVSKLPDQPYEAHTIQAKGQVNLLQYLWNKPVFSLRNNPGKVLYDKVSFPELCKNQFGISLPKQSDKISVESWLVYFSMQDAACFGPYVYKSQFLPDMLEKANSMWQQFKLACKDITALDNIPYAQGYHPLCAYCHVSADCPKYVNIKSAKEWNETLTCLMKLKSQKAEIEDHIKHIETELKCASKNVEDNCWLETGEYRFRLNNIAGRKILDKDLLRTMLDDIFKKTGLDGMTATQVIEQCEKLSAPSTRLQIMPVK